MTERVVVKIGGSLLRGTHDELAHTFRALRDWLDGLPQQTQLLLAGGGAPVDELRQQCSLKKIDEEASHWKAIRLMDLNTDFLANRLQVPVLDGFRALTGTARRCVTVSSFLRQDDVQPDHLPHSWDVTSDSIAAQIALRCGADLILLKSCPLPAASTQYHWPSLASAGIVDAHFPYMAAKLRSITLANIASHRFNKAKKARR
jgi:aspartokinase-like uncharacterized kinase